MPPPCCWLPSSASALCGCSGWPPAAAGPRLPELPALTLPPPLPPPPCLPPCAAITRDSRHKRRATGGRRHPHQKKRKFEVGKPPAMTKIGPKRIHLVRGRGGTDKHRAMRLEQGNFAWGSEHVTRKTRILDVVYNASNNELVRTKTLVKSAVVVVDATPFTTWYKAHYRQQVVKRNVEGSNQINVEDFVAEGAGAAKSAIKAIKARQEGKAVSREAGRQSSSSSRPPRPLPPCPQPSSPLPSPPLLPLPPPYRLTLAWRSSSPLAACWQSSPPALASLGAAMATFLRAPS